jgi:predicted  nucleic acid-binding Zn-ribbon protein
VIAPREAEALMHEIETINTTRGELDEQELLALDEQGAAEAETAHLEAALVPATAAADEAAATWSAADAQLDAEAAALRVKRAEAAGVLSASELAAYEHARSQFGGVAVARLEGRTCSGCHLDLSPGEVDAVKRAPAGELPECPQCNRYLVR